jgi:two-component system chemotaxis response regulator CheY
VKKKIMIVDDSVVMRLMLKNLFEGNGFEVVAELTCGADAVAQYPLVKPDLTTMDITMSDMDGITAVREILKIDPQARIIMCSAISQTVKVKAAVLAGAKAFLLKPLQPDEVLDTVKRIIR